MDEEEAGASLLSAEEQYGREKEKQRRELWLRYICLIMDQIIICVRRRDFVRRKRTEESLSTARALRNLAPVRRDMRWRFVGGLVNTMLDNVYQVHLFFLHVDLETGGGFPAGRGRGLASCGACTVLGRLTPTPTNF